MNCKFELREISCAQCGRPTDDIGTCEDITLCAVCRAEMTSRSDMTLVSQIMINIIEGGGRRFWPRNRRMRLEKNGSRPTSVRGLKLPSNKQERK